MEETLYIEEIAGHCNELTAWRVLKEISEALLTDKNAKVSPVHIEIKEDGGFALSTQNSVIKDGFESPEVLKGESTETSSVWSLAATLFYLVMGRQIMNGKGGAAQQESSRLPYMRSTLPQLSELIQRCLSFHPEERPSLQEINDLATQQYDICSEKIKKGPAFQEKRYDTEDQDDESSISEFWPETMRPENINNKK